MKESLTNLYRTFNANAKKGKHFFALVLLVVGLFLFNVTWASTAYTGIRNITALQFTADMGAGWNLGNTLDAHGDWASGLATENCWGNPTTTKAMITKVKQKGFKTIRIPITWYQHVGGAPNYTIDSDWLNRVEDVMNYAFDNDMYVIINTHHEEGHWLIPTYAKETSSKNQLVKIWTQLANRFKDYGDYLIFETINEPRVHGGQDEWNGGTSENRTVVNRLNKAAVDAIRTTGGNNANRFIMCPTVAASTSYNAINGFQVPNNDPKVIVSLHSYFPYNFALNGSGTSSWGSTQDKSDLDAEMKKIKNKFIDNGIAVVMGEWGSLNKNNTSTRANHASYYVNAAKSNKIAPVLWDDGGDFKQLNRSSLSWYFSSIVDNIISAIGSDTGGGNVDDIVSINAPGSVQVGSTVTVTVQYKAKANRDVRVNFQLDSSPWTSYKSLKKDVSAGSGTLTFNVAIPSNTPVKNDAYQFQVYITTDGGGWSNKLDNIAKKDVDVTSGGSSDSNGDVVHMRKRNASEYAIDGGYGGGNNQNVFLYSQSSSNENQQWVEIDRGEGYYSYKKMNTNYCLDGGIGGSNNQNVKLWTCGDNNQNQHWKKISAGSSYYRLEKRNAPGYSIDGGNGGGNNQNLKLYSSNHSNKNQHWRFATVSTKSGILLIDDSEEMELESDFAIYPNPASNYVTFKSENTNVIDVQIYNVCGQLVYRVKKNNKEISIETNEIGPKGIYYVKSNRGNKKLIIQ